MQLACCQTQALRAAAVAAAVVVVHGEAAVAVFVVEVGEGLAAAAAAAVACVAPAPGRTGPAAASAVVVVVVGAVGERRPAVEGGTPAVGTVDAAVCACADMMGGQQQLCAVSCHAHAHGLSHHPHAMCDWERMCVRIRVCT